MFDLLAAVLGTLLYWYLLYHTTWAYGLAIFSIAFFGLATIVRVVTALVALVTLCMVGTLELVSDFDCDACCLISFIGTLVAFIVAADLIIATYGLTLSMHLMNSGAATCPIGGNDCGWLVVIFFITLLTNLAKSKKVKTTTEQQTPQASNQNLPAPPQNPQAPPIYTAYGRARVLAAPFIFDPRSTAVYQTPSPSMV